MKMNAAEICEKKNKLLGEIYSLRWKLLSADKNGVFLRNAATLENEIEVKKEILLRLFEYRDKGIDFKEK